MTITILLHCKENVWFALNNVSQTSDVYNVTTYVLTHGQIARILSPSADFDVTDHLRAKASADSVSAFTQISFLPLKVISMVNGASTRAASLHHQSGKKPIKIHKNVAKSERGACPN